ncbi:hypothetical protein ACOSP7_020765 [Xanthoceras sorbifolium]
MQGLKSSTLQLGTKNDAQQPSTISRHSSLSSQLSSKRNGRPYLREGLRTSDERLGDWQRGAEGVARSGGAGALWELGARVGGVARWALGRCGRWALGCGAQGALSYWGRCHAGAVLHELGRLDAGVGGLASEQGSVGSVRWGRASGAVWAQGMAVRR